MGPTWGGVRPSPPDPCRRALRARSGAADDAELPVPSPGPNTSGTTVGANTQSSSRGRAGAILCPVRGGGEEKKKQTHWLCLKFKEESKISLPCARGRGWEGPQPACLGMG